MNLLYEFARHGNLFLDIAGVLGLGFVALAAARLAHTHRSWGGTMMGWGAAALLAGRVYVLSAPQFLDRELLASLGHHFISAATLLPVVLLTAGLAGVVWGLWGHERWLNER